MDTMPDYNQLYNIVEEQGGYFTAAQARDVGFSWERLSNSVKTGKFQRAAPGVYRLVQFPASAHEDLIVAWLVTGPNSTISHESALAFYELSDVLPAEVHVIVPRTASRRRVNIRQHTNQLAPDEVTRRGGLQVTSVVRTITGDPRSAPTRPGFARRSTHPGRKKRRPGQKGYPGSHSWRGSKVKYQSSHNHHQSWVDGG
jgi:predicted transcriptional regulator of viral defense system